MFALLSITCFIYRIIRQNILERQNVVVAAYMSNRHFKGLKNSPVCQAVSGVPFPNRNLQSFCILRYFQLCRSFSVHKNMSMDHFQCHTPEVCVTASLCELW